MKITSVEALDSHVSEIVRLKIQHAAQTAQMEMEIATIQKRFAPKLANLCDGIRSAEADAQIYCEANRAAIFPERKSRETISATFGFELTPPRVETAGKRIKWKDVVDRLARLSWGAAYLRQADARPDKEALLADRQRLSAEQCTSAGIEFVQDEQFFIRPKPESAQVTVLREAA